jgi:benzylsuccinate CoA-transferase BbsF subunit
MSVDKLLSSPQYAERGYFVDVELPGHPAKLPTTPFTGNKRSLPSVDQRAEELETGSPPAVSQTPEPRGFLDGVRVLDLTFNRAGPSCTAAMAAFGAEVIRVESQMRIDPNRMRRSVAGQVVYADADTADLETRWSFGSINMGKKSILLNLQASGMHDVLRRLVEVSDVVVESFTPGTIERFGIGFETLQQWRQDVILISINGFGRGGPYEGYRAYADIFGAAGGLQLLTGYPDRPPMQFVGRLDSVVGSFGMLGGLAALFERAKTGWGQHVEVSAAEAVTCLLGTPLIDYIVNGRVANRTGNRVPSLAPHNCYPCKGDDDWVAIAVETEPEWQSLCACMGQRDAATAARFSTVDARKGSEEALDELVASWTIDYSSYEAAEMLQAAGVPASPSMRPDHLFNDPHLNERGVWVRFDHPVQGERHDVRLPWLFSNGECSYGPAPMFGQHSKEVYEGLLGMSEEEVVRLAESRVIY